MKYFLLLLAASLLFPSGSEAAGFDCSQAKSQLEVLICGDAKLSALDGQVGDAYSQLRSTMLPDSDERAGLLSKQREFLQRRSEICPIPSTPNLSESQTSQIVTCLKGFYTLRLNHLQKRLAASTSQDTQPAPQEQATAEADDTDDTDDDSTGATEADTQTDDDVASAQEAITNAIAAFNAQDYPTAVKWFSIGAYKYHDPRAQNDLAKFYANGLGTDQDYPKALKLFHEAASHGTGKIKADAESSVGVMYAKGWGVPQDSEKATHWLKESATHGNRDAKTNLAILHKPGASFKSNAARIHSGSLHMAAAHDKRPERSNKEKKSNGRNTQ